LVRAVEELIQVARTIEAKTMTKLRIDEEFVRAWAGLYLRAQTEDERRQEDSLFAEIGPRVRGRGHFTLEEFLAVGNGSRPEHADDCEGTGDRRSKT
jgi:hypothetical protein